MRENLTREEIKKVYDIICMKFKEALGKHSIESEMKPLFCGDKKTRRLQMSVFWGGHYDFPVYRRHPANGDFDNIVVDKEGKLSRREVVEAVLKTAEQEGCDVVITGWRVVIISRETTAESLLVEADLLE